MSYHILHVFRHGSMLCKEAGFILLKDKNQIVGRMAVEDIRAVVIAARGVTISSNFLSAIIESDAVVLHCDETYKPSGFTAGLARIVSTEAAYTQADTTLKIHNNLWKLVLAAKIRNQIGVLKILKANTAFMEKQLAYGNPSESNCSRFYWRHFFMRLGEADIRRRGSESTPLNAKLNYAYAVLAALIHRSVIIHGLNPLFGIHHKSRAKSYPLVYDLIEPLRAFVDKSLIEFEIKGGDMKEWAKHTANNLKDTKIRHRGFNVKLMDSLESYVSSVAECFRKRSIKFLNVPEL